MYEGLCRYYWWTIPPYVRNWSRCLLGQCRLLWYALQSNNEYVSKLLIDRGAKLDITDANGNSFLHDTSRLGFGNLVSLLLSKGASPNVVNMNGDTPLHVAVRYGYSDIANLLMLRGCITNATNGSGRTCLHEAALRGEEAMVKRLLHNGAVRDIYTVIWWCLLWVLNQIQYITNQSTWVITASDYAKWYCPN